MTIMTSFAARRSGARLRSVRDRRPQTPATNPVALTTVHLLDGGAPHGNLSGAVRHALELHGALSADQRLALGAPAALPRPYTPGEAAVLADALTAAGARVAVEEARAVA